MFPLSSFCQKMSSIKKEGMNLCINESKKNLIISCLPIIGIGIYFLKDNHLKRQLTTESEIKWQDCRCLIERKNQAKICHVISALFTAAIACMILPHLLVGFAITCVFIMMSIDLINNYWTLNDLKTLPADKVLSIESRAGSYAISLVASNSSVMSGGVYTVVLDKKLIC